jgi:transcription elongation factor Elf1
MYEKKVLKILTEFNVNTCPHCDQQFVILATFDDGGVLEQVGPRIYCYLCGKRFKERWEI